MTAEKTHIVVTSIFSPNESLTKLAKGASKNGWDFIIIGDSKSPKDFHLEGSTFFDLASQRNFEFQLASLCPEKHYTRKNLGYLIAIKKGCQIIIETDDDNIPGSDFWSPRTKKINAFQISGNGWVNAYNFYSDQFIWPRGLPLEDIATSKNPSISDSPSTTICPIQQGLADGNPDVDAVYRMTRQLPITFKKLPFPVKFQKGVWTPFNSQNTTWFKEAFPLLYLPSFCTFRMTDIWRSLVAQRIAWECDWEIAFHNATVYQERNEHNLLRDFEQEVPGYLLNNKIKESLEQLPLKKGIDHIQHNMLLCYQALIEKKIIEDEKEMTLLSAWLSDLNLLTR